jgi:hypothetical protein
MKPIHSVRKVIDNIPGAIYEVPPEEVSRGYESGIQTLWDCAVPHPEDAVNLASGDTEPSDSAITPQQTQIEELFEFGADIDHERLLAAFGGSEGDKIRKSVEANRGTDALAWYVTFHGKGVQWGIYVPISSIDFLMIDLFGHIDCDSSTRFRMAFRVLHQHELFHFAVDYMAAQLESIVGAPCHKPARDLKDKQLGYILLEEQLANAHMIRSFRSGPRSNRVRGATDAVREFVRNQPPGYRDGAKSTSPHTFPNECEELGLCYGECIPGYDPRGLEAVDLTALYPIRPQVDWRYCPIHIIHDEARLAVPAIELGLFQTIQSILEPETFLDQLSKTPSSIQKRWQKTKNVLKITTSAQGLDFKRWKSQENQQVFSIRLSDNYRVHLLYSRSNRSWTAAEVGPHTAMGHG